jgi:hypothetical protein
MADRRIDRREAVRVAGAAVLGAFVAGCSRGVPSPVPPADGRAPREVEMGEQEWLA